MSNPILDLLRANHGWDVEPSARPYKPTIEQAIAEGRTPEANFRPGAGPSDPGAFTNGDRT